jgi:hypothetical protein
MHRSLGLVLASLACACSSASVDSTGRGTDAGPPGDGAPVGPGCTAGCAPGTFCSTSGSCIADGTCASDGDCASGHRCAAGACVLGSACGAEALASMPVPPNLLIVLDRSCSMEHLAGGVPKWTSAVEALTGLMTTYAGAARWGLSLFPDREGNECRQDAALPVPIAAGTEAAISSLLTAALDPADRNYPEGPCVTNIDTAMEQALTVAGLSDTDRAGYVLLVTDGRQSGTCRGGSDARTFVAIETLAARGVPTFVVGFGDGVDPDALNEFARLGGTARAGSELYYQADDAAGLTVAFDEIVRGVVSCEYAITPPDDLSRVYVFLDDTREVMHDESHANGWDYDTSTGRLTFYGAPCDDLRAGRATDVDVVFGCPEPTLD